ncbi:MAG: TonB-dependent receptor [Bacteroidota bacterium]|nr:TonB-dependent receptor [Bacteroidota bacterium]
MKIIQILTLLVLFSFKSFSQERFTLNGYITDSESGESLIGATVFINEINSGTVTNPYGFYSITLDEGNYNIDFRYIGYNTISREINLSSNTKIDIELASSDIQLESVVVSDVAEDYNISSIEMSTSKLDMSKVTEIPTFLGENDIIKAIQLLPGVSSVGEGASGFNVRGGSVGQNLVLLDEAPVYNSSHLLGFLSVFNPDAVKDLKLYKGGIPSRYGGRISSILDIRMKDGNKKKVQLSGGIGTIFSRLTLESPIVKDKSSFILALRRSYADVLAKPFLKNSNFFDDGAALNFYDITAKSNFELNENNTLYISSYVGRDVFKFDARQGFNWGNRTGTVRWNHLFNDRLFSNFTAIYSNYDYQLAFGSDDRNKFEWDSNVETYNFKPEFTYFVNTNNELSIGAELINYRFEPANAIGVSDGEITDITLPDKYAFEGALYVGNEQKISSLTLSYGLRYSLYSYYGPGDRYEFGEPIFSGDRRPLISVSKVEGRESIKNYSSLEPRLSMNILLGKSSSVKASYNRMTQYIHLLSNTAASSSLDVWTPSTNNIKPEIADAYVIGYFKNFKNNTYEASIELYYKDLQNQIDYIDGADLLINKYLEGDLLTGIGRAYGLEFLFKKNRGRFNGWLSYTIGRSELKIDGINKFQWYPTRYDQTHNFKITSTYKISDRVQFSGNFVYLTGTPVTFPSSKFVIQGFVIPHNASNSRHQFRIPDYHRLDFSVTIKGRDEKKNGKARKNDSELIIGVYNVYNRRNPFSIYFSQGDGMVTDSYVPGEVTRLSIIGSFVPSITYNFKF